MIRMPLASCSGRPGRDLAVVELSRKYLARTLHFSQFAGLIKLQVLALQFAF